MPLRSRHDALQRRRFGEVPYGGAGYGAEEIVRRAGRRERAKDFSRLFAGSGRGARRMGNVDYWTGARQKFAVRLQRRILFQLRLWKDGLELQGRQRRSSDESGR